MNTEIDILMITYNRPAYTRLALGRLLETCDQSCRLMEMRRHGLWKVLRK